MLYFLYFIKSVVLSVRDENTFSALSVRVDLTERIVFIENSDLFNKFSFSMKATMQSKFASLSLAPH